MMNSLAVLATITAAGAEIRAAVAELATLKPMKGRGARQVLPLSSGSFELIDDSYNANPASLAAAVDMSRLDPNERWVVLGEMAELGDSAETLHAQSGSQIKAAGVTRLFTVGTHAEASSIAFGEGAQHYSTQGKLIESVCRAVAERAPSPLTILIKGSRSTQMENVVAALTELGAPTC